MQQAKFAIALAVLMICTSLSGCLGSEEEVVTEDSSPFDFDRPISNTTWYHYSGGVDALDETAVIAANITANLTGDNTPFWSSASYYGIGLSTFEPTMGITSDDNLYMTSWGNGAAGSTAIV